MMMDESNEKTDKSCIILVCVFDSSVGDIRTRFLDMPIVNVGTARNMFNALKWVQHNLFNPLGPIATLVDRCVAIT